MADYKKMYTEMVDQSERALALLEEAKALLIQGEQNAEDIFIESSQREEAERPALKLIPAEKGPRP